MRSADFRLAAMLALLALLAPAAGAGPARAQADAGGPADARTPPGRSGGSVEDELGRSEDRVRSAPFVVPARRTAEDLALSERLARQGMRRVQGKPAAPGEWFWGTERIWIFRRACRWGGEDHDPALFGLALGPGGDVRGALDAGGRAAPLGSEGEAWLCPETLAESLHGERAPRLRIPLDELPVHAWRAVLAAEDHRFFEHEGVDAVGVARAALANVREGSVVQGGSTLTQQLVKNRELTPRRSLGRKVSEAMRALALEAEHSKEEILQAYLDGTYFGHVRGVAVHGLGAAARAWLSKDARGLTLSEAALLAGMIQGPNRLAPDDHPERARNRRDWVLDRMQELGWASAQDVAAARSEPVRARISPPPTPPARGIVAWAAEMAAREAPARTEAGRGVVAETAIDPWLQVQAERVVADRLAGLRDSSPRLAREKLTAALVVLDAASGDVLAMVGGDPADRADRLDRARRARRQPGSTIKPLLLLHALDRCGGHGPIHASTLVLDAPLSVDLPGGAWSPANTDDRYRGAVTVREALVDSLNVPFARLALHCGVPALAASLRNMGLPMPEPGSAPPSLALGAVEVSPLDLARAYAALAAGGRLPEIRAITRLERPGGRGIANVHPFTRAVASPGSAWIVSDMLIDAVRQGTAQAAGVQGAMAAAKTGTSSERRDAWMAGHAQGVVVVAWFGLDAGGSLGLTGAQAAAPAWREVMEAAIAQRTPLTRSSPDDVVVRTVRPDGLLAAEDHPDGRRELYRRGETPRRARWWRSDEAAPILR